MYFLAFYERVGVAGQSFLAVTQDLTEPARMLSGGIDRDKLDGYAVGDVVRVSINPTNHTFTGEITVIQPDGRYSVDKADKPPAYSTVHPEEIQEVLEESHESEALLLGVIMHPKKPAAEQIRTAVCKAVGHDPVAEWWDVSSRVLEAAGKQLGEDLWIDYDHSLSLEGFQNALLN